MSNATLNEARIGSRFLSSFLGAIAVVDLGAAAAATTAVAVVVVVVVVVVIGDFFNVSVHPPLPFLGPGAPVRSKMIFHESRTVQIPIFRCLLSFVVVVET